MWQLICEYFCVHVSKYETSILALYGKDKDLVPIFITVDPERDTPEVVGEYVKGMSPISLKT